MGRPSRLCWHNCARGSRSRVRVRLPVRLVEECDREAHERGQHQPQVQHLASGHACFSHRSLHPCHHSRKIATMIHTKKTIAKLTANTHRNPVSPSPIDYRTAGRPQRERPITKPTTIQTSKIATTITTVVISVLDISDLSAGCGRSGSRWRARASP